MDMTVKPSPNPTFPAKAGTQIQPERLGRTRLISVFDREPFVGSIWAPAFAGEIGKERGHRPMNSVSSSTTARFCSSSPIVTRIESGRL